MSAEAAEVIAEAARLRRAIEDRIIARMPERPAAIGEAERHVLDRILNAMDDAAAAERAEIRGLLREWRGQ